MTESKKIVAGARGGSETGRDVWQEVLDAVWEIKAGGGRRVEVAPVSDLQAENDGGEVRQVALRTRRVKDC